MGTKTVADLHNDGCPGHMSSWKQSFKLMKCFIGIKWVAKFQIQVVHNPNFIVMQMLCKSSIISWNVPLLRLPLPFPRITNTVRIISLPNKLSPLKQIGLNLTSLE